MSTHTIALENATLTRVGYVDVTIPPEVAGLTADDFAQIAWRWPLWVEGDQLRAGAAAWFADIAGTRLVFDPVQAADNVLRTDRASEAAQQAAIAHLFADAGFARESVDVLVMTHIEGVGMVAWRNEDGSWSPFFPNASVLVSDVALRAFADAAPDPNDELQQEAWQALIDQGLVDTYADGDMILNGLSAEVKGAHCPGHAVLHFSGAAGTPVVTMLGHLAISPLHLATGECSPQHSDPIAAWSLLRGAADDGRMLIGPLLAGPRIRPLGERCLRPWGLAKRLGKHQFQLSTSGMEPSKARRSAGWDTDTEPAAAQTGGGGAVRCYPLQPLKRAPTDLPPPTSRALRSSTPAPADRDRSTSAP